MRKYFYSSVYKGISFPKLTQWKENVFRHFFLCQLDALVHRWPRCKLNGLLKRSNSEHLHDDQNSQKCLQLALSQLRKAWLTLSHHEMHSALTHQTQAKVSIYTPRNKKFSGLCNLMIYNYTVQLHSFLEVCYIVPFTVLYINFV